MDVSGTASGNQPAFSPTSSVPVKVPVTKVSYHGKSGQVFRLHLMNLLMNIITLGIYSFWGKTRIRRYMTSHVAILDDRFEYTGTGKELLFGWLKAMLIFFPLLMCLSIPGVNIIGFLAFSAIFSVAIYLTLRYRLSRTKWRGIRFRLAGSIKSFFWLSLKRGLINIFTLGFKIPKSDILLWSYIANNMSYGDLKFSYKGDHKKLRKVHLITMAILIVAMIAALAPLVSTVTAIAREEVAQKKVQQAQTVQTIEKITPPSSPDTVFPVEDGTQVKKIDVKKSEIEPKIVGAGMIFYLGLGIGLLARLWYNAALWCEKFRGLYLGDIRFKADVTGGALAKLYIVNLLIIIFTLGLGKPIAANRTLRYYATNMRIGGDLKALIAKQEALLQKSGMGDALAADVGFDLGL
jgi:uncharacterized membrane protein YjgN (DUF898 family)